MYGMYIIVDKIMYFWKTGFSDNENTSFQCFITFVMRAL